MRIQFMQLPNITFGSKGFTQNHRYVEIGQELFEAHFLMKFFFIKKRVLSIIVSLIHIILADGFYLSSKRIRTLLVICETEEFVSEVFDNYESV